MGPVGKHRSWILLSVSAASPASIRMLRLTPIRRYRDEARTHHARVTTVSASRLKPPSGAARHHRGMRRATVRTSVGTNPTGPPPRARWPPHQVLRRYFRMWTRLLLSLALGAALIACTPAGGSSPAATVQPS